MTDALRRTLLLFPVFVPAASIRHDHVRTAPLFAPVLLPGLDITLFVNSYWAG